MTFTRSINFTLAALQILTIIAIAVAIIALIKLYHHQTDDYAVPFLHYLGSIRIAVPPIIALFVSYFLAFVSGISLVDAPRLIIRFLRNEFFQSLSTMTVASCALLLISAAIAYYTIASPPPSYSRLVAILLGGEQDRQVLIGKELKLLAEENSDLAEKFELAADVFLERSRRNFSHQVPNTTTPRIFVRALDANVADTGWQAHPLRKLALAEAYSMWAQAALASPLRQANDAQWREWLRRSIELDKEVVESPSPLATVLMRHSALNNNGNALFYTGDARGAAQIYEEVLAINPNLSSYGNLIAAYILLDDLDKAIAIGDRARDWGMATGKGFTETSAFSGVVGNAAFAYLIREQYKEASERFLEAYDLEPDNLNALNLALALLLEGKTTGALQVLSQFRYPDLALPDQKSRVLEDYDACYYLVRALAIGTSEYPTVAAHLYTYLRVARTAEQLSLENAESNSGLRRQVLKALQEDATPCGDLSRVPKLRAWLGGQ
jgi:tetratricopeptide (TPR) repeat protein